MRFGDSVVDAAAFPLDAEKAAPLHQPKVLRGHVARDLAGLGELAHRVAAAEQQLHDPQAVRMGQRLEALRRLRERIEAQELGACLLYTSDAADE